MEKISEFIRKDGDSFPGKTYVVQLLKPVFNDQRDYLFHAMFDIHRAHVIMLAEQGIIERKEAQTILTGVNKVANMDPSTLQYHPDFEDLFFMMEAKIGEEIGVDLAGKIHIGRSRNDMGVTMYRLVLRKHLLNLIESATQLNEALLMQAENYKNTIMPAYTHTQPAQPTTLGHYLLAIYDVLQRDIKRLWNAFNIVNQSPMGAAALTTTGFPINRQRVCELLAFDRIVENSYDCIAGADYLLECAAAIMTCMTNMGRWIQDFLQHVTKEYNSFYVGDPYVQVSSIMPQKRNPVSIEHSRSLASSAIGEAMSVMQMVHNTPFGDIVDTEDDLQPHLYRGFKQANRAMKLMYAVILTMKVNKEHLKKKARLSCLTITELADTLTREHQLSFRKAHAIASSIARESAERGKELDDWTVDEINEHIQPFVKLQLTKEQWEDIISPEKFIEKRKIQGGPNVQEVERMIHERKSSLEEEIKKLETVKRKIQEKSVALKNYQL
jgi:argininosuccinate lyase